MGCAPFAPLLSHFLHMANPRPYEDWLKLDLEWVEVCDVLLRIGGESKGADGEVDIAIQLNKQIFYNLEDLKEWLKTL